MSRFTEKETAARMADISRELCDLFNNAQGNTRASDYILQADSALQQYLKGGKA